MVFYVRRAAIGFESDHAPRTNIYTSIRRAVWVIEADIKASGCSHEAKRNSNIRESFSYSSGV